MGLFGFDIRDVNKKDRLRIGQPLIEFVPPKFSLRRLPHKDNAHSQASEWQFEVLKNAGLRPEHFMLEIGPGGFHLGRKLITYLQPSHYYGADVSEQGLIWGWNLIGPELRAKKPKLYWGGEFNFEALGQKFDYAWAHSVFTHLNWNDIGKCLYELRHCVNPTGQFMATMFVATGDPWKPQPYGKGAAKTKTKLTYYHKDPYHYPVEVIQQLAASTGWRAEITDLKNIKTQTVVRFQPLN